MKLFKKLTFILLFVLIFTGCTSKPTPEPTVEPTIEPTVEPTVEPTIEPTIEPTVEPTIEPTIEPTVEPTEEPLPEYVDYVSQTKLDLNDASKIWAEVKVSTYVDGDTTHFIPKGTPSVWINDEDNILKARYNSCDTPESTGKVEPWGESAKKWTRKALENAQSIIIQSDTDKWTTDSTGGRYLVWVWYRNSENEDYRLLNLELIQEGLAKLKSASSYSLYETFNAANMQAILYEKCVYSKEKDPNYYYGVAQVITIMELRQNLEKYSGTKVCVNGLITVYDSYNHMAYAQAYDVDSEKWYGIDVYLGYNNYEIIKVGNLVRLVGTLSYYETGQSWQLTGLSYHRMNPDYEGSMKLLDKGIEVTPQMITSADLSIVADENGRIPGEDIQAVYVKINDLFVYDVYTTKSTITTSNGAMTLYCRDSNGVEVIIRTSVLKDENKEMVVEEDVLNKTISPSGIVTKYDGKVQIHVYTLNELSIAN